MSETAQAYFKKCSSCKKEIPYASSYYVCSVSTCRHKRKGFHFCSVPCWDAHLGYANHREAWAVEETAPAAAKIATKASSADSNAAGREPRRAVVSDSQPVTAGRTASVAEQAKAITADTLVVVSKVKKLIKEQAGFSTSQCCIDALTQKVVEESLKGIANARSAERKTVMGRDIE